MLTPPGELAPPPRGNPGSATVYSLIITVCNEVAKVMFSQACVCPQGGVPGPGGGVCSQGGLLPGGSPPGDAWSQGGAWSWGVSAPGGYLFRGMSVPRGVGISACTEADPPGRDGYCCGRYASYWNAFLLMIFLVKHPRRVIPSRYVFIFPKTRK